MDRFSGYGLRGDQDEQFRRAVRDGFRAAGLGPAQMTAALEWYKDHVRPGMDETKLAESFAEFAAGKGWAPEHLEAATAVYEAIRDGGPEATMAPTPSAEEDAALIARANELLRTDAKAYWKDEALQEAQFEALERQQAAPQAEPSPDDDAIERKIAQQDVDRFAAMLRDPASAAKYWASAELQRRHHDAIAAAYPEAQEAPAPAAQPVAPVAAAAVPVAAAAPVKAAPATDPATRRLEIEALMRGPDARQKYWGDAAVQNEYLAVLAAPAAAAAPVTTAAPAVAAEPAPSSDGAQ
jgi:hypothetical protein